MSTLSSIGRHGKRGVAERQPRGNASAGARDLTTAHMAAAYLPGGLGRALIASADNAFTVAMDRGMLVCTVVALAGALAALRWLPSRVRVASVAPEPELVAA